MKTLLACCITLTLLWGFPRPSFAQSDDTLYLMVAVSGELGEDDTADWHFTAPVDSTLIAQTLSGSLDPTLQLFNADGDLILQGMPGWFPPKIAPCS